MASKAWDSIWRLPGLIVESRTVIDRIVEMSGRLAAAGAPFSPASTCGPKARMLTVSFRPQPEPTPH